MRKFSPEEIEEGRKTTEIAIKLSDMNEELIHVCKEIAKANEAISFNNARLDELEAKKSKIEQSIVEFANKGQNSSC